MNNNTYTLIMIDELGSEIAVGTWNLSLLTDPDEIQAWKQIKLEKARMSHSEAQGFFWEGSASLYWAIAEAIEEEDRFVDEDDEDDRIEGARNNAPCDTYGLCPYSEQCDLYCNREDTAETPPKYVEDDADDNDRQ